MASTHERSTTTSRHPVTEAQVRALRVDDTVTLQGTLFGIRDATQIHMFDRGRKTRFDLAGHAVIHTAPNVRKVAPSADHPTGYAPVCIGTTTSARMERFTRPLMARVRRAPDHRQGRPARGTRSPPSANSAAPISPIVGGTAALETTWIEQIEDVDLDDLHPEACGASACAISGRCWSPWIATAAASTAASTRGARRDARLPGRARREGR